MKISPNIVSYSLDGIESLVFKLSNLCQVRNLPFKHANHSYRNNYAKFREQQRHERNQFWSPFHQAIQLQHRLLRRKMDLQWLPHQHPLWLTNLSPLIQHAWWQIALPSDTESDFHRGRRVSKNFYAVFNAGTGAKSRRPHIVVCLGKFSGQCF